MAATVRPRRKRAEIGCSWWTVAPVRGAATEEAQIHWSWLELVAPAGGAAIESTAREPDWEGIEEGAVAGDHRGANPSVSGVLERPGIAEMPECSAGGGGIAVFPASFHKGAVSRSGFEVAGLAVDARPSELL